MSKWQDLTTTELFREWKTFRESIQDEPIYTQLEQIALFFSTVPVGKCDIDIYDSSTWSSPWNIMADRSYSKSTVSILMEITCRMVNKSKSNIELVAIDDGSEKYLVPMINQHLVLNYNSGRVVTIEDINEQISILGHISTDKYRY